MSFTKTTLILAALLIIGLQNTGSAQGRFFKNSHFINGPTSRELDNESILVYIDDSNLKTIEDIRMLPQNEYIESSYISHFDQSRTYWLYYIIINTSDKRLSQILKGGNNSKETYYIQINDEEVIESKTGAGFPVNQRSIAQGYDTKIRLDIPPKAKVNVYVKVESLFNMPISLSASLEPYDIWSQKKEQVNLFEGFFSGLILVIFTLSIFLYGYTKQKVFIYFALYSLFNTLYFLQHYGIVELWFWPGSPNRLAFLTFTPALSTTFYCLFARSFLDLEKALPIWNKLLKWVGLASVTIFFLLVIFLQVSNNLQLALYSFEVYMVVVTLLGIVFLFFLNRRTNLFIGYFTWGTVFLLITVLTSASANTINQPLDIPIYIQIGLIIELFVFCLGLSHKLKRNFENHEITQKSLILQLKNNEKLQLNINQELTELVAARTQVIKKQNQELEVARNEAERATKAKSEFLSVMSHEIRTPLNAIISLSHIMEMDNENEEMQEYIDALKFSAENLHSLINDVLDYNKIEAGKLVLESIEFSVIDLLRNIRDSFKYKARSQGIDLFVEVGEHMPDRVIGDPTRLTQIFNNLIGNAIKFTHEGHVHIKASLLGLKDDVATVTFEVNDTGIGIPRDKLEKIFEEYEQAAQETTREYGGTGLGLSITQKLLNMMGSQVRIESAEQEGTSLSFDISFKINQAFDMVSLQDQMRDKDLNEKNILVVDDNDMNRLVLKRLLSSWNARFDEASGGETALSKCAERKYDLILLDIEMKPISGFEVASIIRTTCEHNKETIIIAMSAFLSSEFQATLNKDHFSALIHKPFEPNELYRQILKYIKLNNE